MSDRKRSTRLIWADEPDMVPLSSGILVPREYHDALFCQVTGRIPHLEFGARLKARDMVDPDNYALCSNAERWRIGCCVAHWEREEKIPVHFLGCPYCSVRYYERI